GYTARRPHPLGPADLQLRPDRPGAPLLVRPIRPLADQPRPLRCDGVVRGTDSTGCAPDRDDRHLVHRGVLPAPDAPEPARNGAHRI
ncbi:MAG: hypothetical protein AVDCRST_MAG19-717, partial [uncultured Thermomicrobiales bacterium]